jgi:hypothetical protein
MKNIATTILFSTALAIAVIVAKVAGVVSVAFLVNKLFTGFKPSHVTSAVLISAVVFLVCLAFSRSMTAFGVNREDVLIRSWGSSPLWLAGLTVSAIPLAALITQPFSSFEIGWGVEYATRFLLSTGMLAAYAFSEEVAFRQAFLRNHNSGKWGTYISWVIQAALFWLLHRKSGMLPWEGFFWYFSMGLLLGAIYLTLGLAASTTVHTFANVSVAQLHYSPTWLPAPMVRYPLEAWFELSLSALAALAFSVLLLVAIKTHTSDSAQDKDTKDAASIK